VAAPGQKSIYVIGDPISKKAYVGSSENLVSRLKEHDKMLRTGTHHNVHLQRAFDKHGSFVVVPIPIGDDSDVRVIEQQLINEFYDDGGLFNIARDTTAPRLGMPVSDESRERMRQAQTGRKHSPETIELLKIRAKERGVPRATIEAGAASRVGKSLTPEHVEKVRQASIERMQDPERRALSGTAMLGKKHSPEAIAKMKAACQGRKPSPQAMAARDAYNQLRRGNLTSTGN